MITSVIQAGFGNQLFQYAMAYAVAKDCGQELCLNTSFFDHLPPGQTPREYQLDKLALDAHRRVSDSKVFGRYVFLSRLAQRFPRLIRLLFPAFICENMRDCREYQGHLLEQCRLKDSVLFGFWQHTRYFARYRNELCRQFVPSYTMVPQASETLARIKADNSVGVHIRRGDFVALGWDKGQDYYDKGMAFFRSRYADARFYIVTDDVAWARARYAEVQDVEVVDIQSPTKDLDEFYLLSCCHHQLISESTYGWWAAYLNSHADKTVVAPAEARGEIFENDWVKL